jgi:hypothetical protein
MYSPLGAYPAVLGRRMTPGIRRLARLAGVSVLVALAQGCTAQPLPLAGPDPANPAARVKATAFRSNIAPYESRRPVEPKPWADQNSQVAPKPQP